MKQTTHNSDSTINPFALPQTLLKDAKHQLHISRFLYFIHQYPDSIFHLQQALELLAKAFVTASTNNTNIKAFGHDICKVAPNVWKDIEKDWLNPSDPNHTQKAETAEFLKKWVVEHSLEEKINDNPDLQKILALPLPVLMEHYHSAVWKKGTSQNSRTAEADKLFGTGHSTEEVQQYLNDIRKNEEELKNIQKIQKHRIPDSEILGFFDIFTQPDRTRSPTFQKMKEQERLKNYKNTYLKTKEGKITASCVISVFRYAQTIPEMLIPLSILIQEHQQPCRYLDPANPQETDPHVVYNRNHYLIKNYSVLYRHMRILATHINRNTIYLMRLDNAGILKKVQKIVKKSRK